MKNTEQLLQLAKRIQALSEIGLHYASDEYNQDRYAELEEIAKELMSIITNNSIGTINMGISERDAYKTPKVDVRAVVFNEKNEILMVREKIDDKWSLPGGWADIGYSPAEVAVKETREEAGQNVKAIKLLGVMDKKCHNHPPDINYLYKIFILCEALDDTIAPGYETTDAAYFAYDSLPDLSTPRNTKEQIEIMFSFRDQKSNWPYLDLN